MYYGIHDISTDRYNIIQYKKNKLIEEVNSLKRKARRIVKSFKYYCPRCLYQTNNYTRICPKCGNARLKKVKSDEIEQKGDPEWYSYYCPHCLHQTNKYTRLCPECRTGRLTLTGYGKSIRD